MFDSLGNFEQGKAMVQLQKTFCIQVQNPGPFVFRSLLQKFSFSVIVLRVLQCPLCGLKGTLETAGCGKQEFGAWRVWENSANA